MRDNIHPNYIDCTVTCSCGSTWQTHSTKPTMHLDVCGNCHPYFTGEQRIVDTAGRVERFRQRQAKAGVVRR